MNSWLEKSEIVELLGIARQNVEKQIASGKLISRKVYNPHGGRGGFKYEILLSSLPQEAQERYWAEKRAEQELLNAKPARKKASASLPETVEENDFFLTAPDWQKKHISKWHWILSETAGMKKSEILEWIRNTGTDVSYSSINRMRKVCKDGGLEALASGYGNRKGDSKIPDDVFAVFRNAYLKQGSPSVQAAYLVALGYAVKNYNTPKKSFPCANSFLYRLQREESESAVFFARYGNANWNKKYGNSITRDYSKIRCGQVAVSDHMQLDIMVSYADGSCGRPWLTAWIDMKSRKFLGWFLHREAPNSDQIFQSFHEMAKNFGLPSEILIDNGKDYRCKDFAGGRTRIKASVDEKYASTLMRDLGIEAHFSLPYNAQTKPIERRFRDFHGYFEKMLVGYTGTNSVVRPEILKKEIKQGKILSFEQADALLSEFIMQVLNKMPGKGVLAGMCPDEMWQRENPTLRRASAKSLALFCTRTSGLLRVGRAGVKDPILGVTYWAEEFVSLKGSYVYLRRDLKAHQTAWAFSDKNELLCQATMTQAINPMCSDDVSKAELKDAMARKKRDQKMASALAKNREALPANEQINYMRAGVAYLNRKRGFEDNAEEQKIIEMQRVPLDAVVRQQEEYLREGTYDRSIYSAPMRQEKHIFLTPGERRRYEESKK